MNELRTADAEYHPEIYDEISPGYYDRVFKRGRGVQWFWHQHRFATVARHLPATARAILDVGCGAGTFLANFVAPSVRAVGIDIAAAQIAYAQQHYQRPGLDFRAGDASALDPGESFDAAVSIELVEHLTADDARGFLRRLHELLVPGGTLILTTPNYRSLWPLLERLVSRIGEVDYVAQHINHFHRERLVSELEAAGFTEVHCESFFVGAPFLAAVSSRLARHVLDGERRLLRRAGAELVAIARKPG